MDARSIAGLAAAAETMLAYLAVADAPRAADMIWGLGSNDVRVAESAAELYHAGLSPVVVFSGGRGPRWTELSRTEAELFRSVAVERGVPEACIVVEDRSTNTGENVAFTLEILDERGIEVSSALLITIPPFQLRAAATVRRHREAIACVNRPVSWGDVAGWDEARLAQAARLCVGEVRRLGEYPALGFIRWDPTTIPREVTEAARRAEELLAERP